MLTDPVTPPLPLFKTLTPSTSTDKASVKLPTRSPAVTASRKLPLTLCPP